MDRELEIAAAASAGGLATRRAGHVSNLGSPCANCATPLEGPYCHACGQLAEDFERSIFSLLVEVFENLFHVDGRLLHTLPRLILRPGLLTRDYLAGHRAAQMPPLRLFLVVILVFFFAGSLKNTIEPAQGSTRFAPGAFKVPEIPTNGSRMGGELVGWLRPRVQYAADHPREFSMAFESWIHRVAIIFLPISTLLLAMLFVFQPRFFIFDHAIFSMHSLAFMGLLFTLITLLDLAPPLRAAAGLLSLAAPVHLFVHMRGFYRASLLGTLVRMALLGMFSAIALGLLLLAVAVLELSGMGA